MESSRLSAHQVPPRCSSSEVQPRILGSWPADWRVHSGAPIKCLASAEAIRRVLQEELRLRPISFVTGLGMLFHFILYLAACRSCSVWGRWSAGGQACLRGHSCHVSRIRVSRSIPCCVEWVRPILAYIFHGPACGHQSAVGPSDAQGSRSLGSGGFWFPVPFPVWLRVHPFACGACAFVDSNQRVGRSPAGWCSCVWRAVHR